MFDHHTQCHNMVPTYVCMVPPHVLYDSHGPSHNLYRMGILWSFLTLYWTGMAPNMYVWSPTCEVSSWHIWLLWFSIPYIEKVSHGPPHIHVVPHLPYMEQVLYGPPHAHMVPHMWIVFMSYMPLMVLPYLIWNRYCTVPHMYVWSPTCMHGPQHVWYDVNDSYHSPIPYMK